MTIIAATALLLMGQARTEVIWTTNMPFALAWAKRVNKPVLAAGMGFQRGVGYLSDATFDQIMSTFVPVEVPSYDVVSKYSKSAPASGMPQLVVLDSSGRMLKRLGGFGMRPSDLQLLRMQVDWIQAEGDSIVKRSSRPDADADTLADAATVLAMRANLEGAMQKLAAATAKHANPAKIINAWEALADEARVGGNSESYTQAIRFYRAALEAQPDPISESRIRLRMASALWRMGDILAAIDQTKIILSSTKFPAEDLERAKRLQVRLQS